MHIKNESFLPDVKSPPDSKNMHHQSVAVVEGKASKSPNTNLKLKISQEKVRSNTQHNHPYSGR